MENKDDRTNLFDEPEIVEHLVPPPKTLPKTILSGSNKKSAEEQAVVVKEKIGRTTNLEHNQKIIKTELKAMGDSITKMLFVIVVLSLLMLGSKISNLDIGMILGGEFKQFSGSLLEVLFQLLISVFGVKATIKYVTTYDETSGEGGVKKSLKESAIVEKIKTEFDTMTKFENSIKK